MAVSPDQVLKEINENKYAPIYFLSGEEPFYIDEITQYIEKNALSDAEKGFNQTVAYGKDVDMARIISEARAFPMMGARKVVIVKEAQEISDFGKENAEKLLEAYLKSPSASTILVFAYKYKNLDKRKKSTKLLTEHTVFVESKKIYDNQLPEWIRNYVATQEYKIDEKATQLIADAIGLDLSRIANEISKLAINVPKGTAITPEIVQQYIGISKEYNVFELVKAIQYKDHLKAQKVLNYFAANPKDNPIIPMFGALYLYLTQMIKVHLHPQKNANGLKMLGINFYQAADYLVAIRNYPLPKIIQDLNHLRIADLQSKGVVGGSMDDAQILKELVYKLSH
jgi:DNA polymerase III subunit delta